MPLEMGDIIILIAAGLFAGTVGGLVGVGGSIIIIPVLTILMDRDQHLSQAAAMIVNVCIAVPSVWQHHRAGAVRWDVVGKMLPLGLIAILVGVEASNQIDGASLKRLFGAFLLYVIVFEMVEFFDDRSRTDEPQRESPVLTWPRVGFVGGLMGFLAGLLGIGGGPVAVPLLYRICRLPLRNAIAASSAVMCVTAAIGSVRKNMAIDGMMAADDITKLALADSLWLAIAIAPGAVVGAMLGAKLTHRLPLRWVRAAFVILIGWACVEMLGVV